MGLARGVAVSAFVVLSLLGAASAADAPEDPPADVTVDLTQPVGSPLALVISTKTQYWQLSHDPARPGVGVGFMICRSPDAPGCVGRVFIDVEALGARKLQAALDDIKSGLTAALKSTNCKVVGEASIQAKPDPVAFGKTKYKGHKMTYSIVNELDPASGEAHVIGTVLEVGKALVVVHTERYQAGATYLDDVLAAMSFVPGPPKKRDVCQVKLLDNTGGLHRYVCAKVPPRWTNDPGDPMEADFAHWTRRDPKTGDLLARVTLFGQVVGKDFDLAVHAGHRRMEYQKISEEVSEPEKVPVGASAGYSITFTAPKGPGGRPAKVRKVVTRVADMSVIWALETTATDEKELAEDQAAFDAILATVKTWTGKVQ